jgi:hypothetical protein
VQPKAASAKHSKNACGTRTRRCADYRSNRVSADTSPNTHDNPMTFIHDPGQFVGCEGGEVRIRAASRVESDLLAEGGRLLMTDDSNVDPASPRSVSTVEPAPAGSEIESWARVETPAVRMMRVMDLEQRRALTAPRVLDQ